MNKIPQSDFTKSNDGKGVISNLGLITPAGESNVVSHSADAIYDFNHSGKYSYFTTINISPKLPVMSQHFEVAMRKVIRGKHLWGDLYTAEQYQFFRYGLNKLFSYVLPEEDVIDYHFFFEHTSRGEIHLHGRVSLEYPPTIKDFELMLLTCLGLKRTKHIILTKKYDHDKWNDYQSKYDASKVKQTSAFKPIYKNIIIVDK